MKNLLENYVEPEVYASAHSFAVCRNPYSRLASLYLYNRYGGCESFEAFLRSWRRCFERAQWRLELGRDTNWDVYCQVLPMHYFTHVDGHLRVDHVIKMEEMDRLGELQLPDPVASVFENR